jgi:hypothetical protein
MEGWQPQQTALLLPLHARAQTSHVVIKPEERNFDLLDKCIDRYVGMYRSDDWCDVGMNGRQH